LDRVRRLADDLLAQGRQGNLDQLEVSDRQRNSDDREAQQDSSRNMSQGKPPSRDDDPDHVAQKGPDSCIWLVHQFTAEWPGGIACHAEGGNAPWDRNDQHAADDPGQHVGEPEPEATEDEPNDVEQGTHLSRFALRRLLRQ